MAKITSWAFSAHDTMRCLKNLQLVASRRFSSGLRAAYATWAVGEGSGRGPPTSQGMQTDRYTGVKEHVGCACLARAVGLRTRRLTPLLAAIGCAALLHLHNRTVLQLYHGSTGAVMFRSGPVRSDHASATKPSTESPLPAGMLTAKRALWRLKFAAQVLPKFRV
jgi:hypothetical protein